MFTRPRLWAVGAMLGVLVLTGVMDGFARAAYRAEVEADTSSRLDALARTLSDAVARETAAADTMAVFVELTDFDGGRLRDAFPVFADALMREAATIRSVQLAPDGVLEFVFPLRGNEAAVGLDLLADGERRNLLLPSIESGRTVMQGPFELVQGGLALAVRHPVYRPDGSFWGFAAVILDWPSVTDVTGFSALPESVRAGIRLPGDDRVIAGDPAAFAGDPLMRSIAVGATDTTWTIAMRPTEGWPNTADITGLVWLFGGVVAALAGVVAHGGARRPELLEAERIAAVDELARSEAVFQATIQHAGVGIVIGDIEGRVVSSNPAFRAIAGRAGEDIARQTLMQFVAEEDRRVFEREMVRAYRRATAVSLDVRVAGVTPTRWVRIRASTIPGESRLFVGIVEDITDRLLAEVALAQSEDRFRRLFEQAPIAIQREDHSAAKAEIDQLRERGVEDIEAWYSEDDQRLKAVLGKVMITDLNPAARQLQLMRLGGDLGPGPLVRHLTENARDGFLRTLAAIAAGETNLEYEVLTSTFQGDIVHLDLKWQVPIVGGEPDYGNVMLTLHDSTDLRETQRRLQSEIQSKDRFIASVAHELRTPLTAVVGFAHELLADVYGEDEKREFQQLIAFHSSELAHLIEDLLVWARADIGEVQVRPESMDLGECVGECIESMPGVEIPLSVTGREMRAFADPSRVRQIVRNLVSNAIRYGGPNPRITVATEGEWAAVEVSDDGPELPPSQRESIFAPYARASSAPSMPGSIGLGLTVSRTLGRLQGGDLVFVREDDRNVFRLTLPQSVSAEPGVANLSAR